MAGLSRKLVLRNTQSPGDLVMLTAAVRDLHASHPGQFYTNVVSSCPDLWEHNPHIRPVGDEGELIHCSYDPRELAHTGMHFIHGFRLNLEKQLGVPIAPGPCRGDIYLSHEELDAPCPVVGRFWLINAGVKNDFTAKQWKIGGFQSVVDHFLGRIQFVQVGASEHIHKPLEGVINLLGKTTIRQLVRLVYWSDGALCGVTALMHLVAAIQTRVGFPGSRPCVVVAGAREPSQWEQYNGHAYLSTINCVPCALGRGCWKSRVVALNDGAEQDKSLCENPTESNGQIIPLCMKLIEPEEVILHIERFLKYE